MVGSRKSSTASISTSRPANTRASISGNWWRCAIASARAARASSRRVAFADRKTWRDRLDARARAGARDRATPPIAGDAGAGVAGAMSRSMRLRTFSIRPSANCCRPSHRDPDGSGRQTHRDAATRNEKVAIFGDYDVDGATSARARWHLRHCGLDPDPHSRPIFEGLRPECRAVRALAAKGATLL